MNQETKTDDFLKNDNLEDLTVEKSDNSSEYGIFITKKILLTINIFILTFVQLVTVQKHEMTVGKENHFW